MEFNVDEIVALFEESCNNLKSVEQCLKEVKKFKELYKSFLDFIKSEQFYCGNQTFGVIGMKHVQTYLLKVKKVSLFMLENQDRYCKVKFKELVYKMERLMEIMPLSYLMSDEDLCSLDKDHSRWQALRKITKTASLSPEQVKAQTKRFLALYNSAKVAFYISTTYIPSKFQSLLTTFTLVYNYLSPKSRKYLLSKCNRKGSLDSQKLLWNTTETSLMKKILYLAFQSIETSQKIYIPRISSIVTEINQIEISNLNYYPFELAYSSEKIGILVLSPFSILSEVPINTLFIHVHGGGNVAQSTFSHQSYTRRWSNSLKLPIFSIEYRLAPDNPFPDGLDDIWQAYIWLVTQCSRQFNIIPDKIVLAGDSAGGNHIVSISLKAKLSGFRVPDCLLAIYPVLTQNPKKVNIGTFLSLNDQILHFHFYRLIRKAYLKDEKLFENPLVSPLEGDDRIFERFPKTRLMICLNDPLFIHSFYFADRLLRVGCDVKVYEYPGFIHGAMNFANPTAIPIYNKFYEDSMEILSELIYK